MKTKTIGDVIADGTWLFPEVMRKIQKGRKTGYIAIGRPRPDTDPRGDWICPIQIDHFTNGVVYAHGVGPLDALLNAMNLLRQFFDMNTVLNLEPVKRKKPASARTSRRVSRRK